MGRHEGERDRLEDYQERVRRYTVWIPTYDGVWMPERWRYYGWFVIRYEPFRQRWWGRSSTLRDPQVHAYRHVYDARNLWRGHSDSLTVWQCEKTTIASTRVTKSSGPRCMECVKVVGW